MFFKRRLIFTIGLFSILVFFGSTIAAIPTADEQAIINAMNNNSILDSKTYIITANFPQWGDILSNHCLQGQKGTIIRSPANVALTWLFKMESNSSIKNITLDENYTSSTAPQYVGNGAIYCNQIADFTIDNVAILNAAGHGIRIDGQIDINHPANSINGSISNCYITNSWDNGIFAQGACQNISVKNNHITNNRRQDCIYFSGIGGYASRDIVITQNTCENSYDFGIEVGDNPLKVPNGDGIDFTHNNIIVSNNIVKNCSCAGIAFRSVNNGTISGNVLTDCGMAGTNPCDGAIFLRGDKSLHKSVTINSNVIVAPNRSYGVYIKNYSDVTISSNKIETGSNNGLGAGIIMSTQIGDAGITYNVSNCNINSNIIINPIYGIDLEGIFNINNISINSNLISGSEIGIRSVYYNGGWGSNFQICSNNISNCIWSGIYLNLTNYVQMANNTLAKCGWNASTPDIKNSVSINNAKCVRLDNTFIFGESTDQYVSLPSSIYIYNSTNVEGKGYSARVWNKYSNVYMELPTNYQGSNPGLNIQQ